ncbi:hypothetical protein CLU79DRAFT_892408 [Phycomyces nitens]|nr:hypothetical protein CLU79DRAFT_892408 [Phycomyces nitens]
MIVDSSMPTTQWPIENGSQPSVLNNESLHCLGLLGYLVEVTLFRWPAPRRQEFLSSHLRRSRLVMMRSVGPDIRLSLSHQLSGIPGGRPVVFSAGESLHGLLGYSIEVNIFRWPALKRQEFLSSHSRRSRLVMMRSVGSDIRLSLSHQLSGILGGRPVVFSAGESLHGLLGYSIEVNIFQWPALRRQEFLSSHSRRSRLVMMRSTQEHGCDSVVLVSVASGIGWATGRFLAGESLHGLLGYSVEVIIFRMACSKTSRVPELPFTAVKAGHDAFCWSRWSPLFIIPTVWNPGWATGCFLAGESLHGLLGYSVEVNIFRWPALKRQEFLRSHSRRSRLVMMRSTQEHGCDSVVLVSVASGIGWATGRFLAGESLHGLLGYSVEVNIFRWPALKRQEFLSSHSRRSRLVMMRSVGSDIRLSLSHQLSGILVDSRTWMWFGCAGFCCQWDRVGDRIHMDLSLSIACLHVDIDVSLKPVVS